jgi:flavodoxin
MKEMKAVIIYWSKSGNTEKVARAIKEGLEASGAEVLVKKPEEAKEIDFYDWDLICLGFPSYRWHPPEPIDTFLKTQYRKYRQAGRVKTGAPKISGKNALIFCTYSGPHTGINEAIPAGKYAGQFFEHLGFTVMGEWYILGEFHGSEEMSTKGRMGDIRGRPSEEDLKKVKRDAATLFLTVSQTGPEVL